MSNKLSISALEKKIQQLEEQNKKLNENNKYLTNRLNHLSGELDSLSDIAFTDLFDLDEIQNIQDAFAESRGIASIITLPDGKAVTKPSNFCKLCKNIVRKTETGLANCIYSDSVIGRYNPKGPIIQPCLSAGLWVGGTSISVSSKHVANWLIGQIRIDTQTDDEMMKYAKIIGVNEDEYRQALDNIIVMPIIQFKLICKSLFLTANLMSKIAYQNVQQAKYIIEKRKNEEDLKKAIIDAQIASNAKTEFLTNLSHELRTPLTAILGYSKLYNKQDNDKCRFMNIIRKNAEHLMVLINDLLDISKIESNKIELRPEDFKLNDFLKNIAEMSKPGTMQKGISFKLDLDSNLPSIITCDEIRLRQILLNLTSNAIKFTNQGIITLNVSLISYNENTAKILFIVEDTGIGIPLEQQEKIFLPFHQFSEKNIKSEGTGLGLAICKKLLNLMESDLNVESVPKKGSKFWFYIDFPVVKKSDLLEEKKSKEKYNYIYEGDRRKILLVDDIYDNRIFLKEMLLKAGFNIYEATTGIDALNIIKIYLPDIIFVDILMPDINGFEIARRIRKITEYSNIILIAIIATLSEETKKKAIESGYNDILSKPFDEKKVFQIIGKILNINWFKNKKKKKNKLKNNFDIPSNDNLDKIYELAKNGAYSELGIFINYIKTLGKNYNTFAEKIETFKNGFEFSKLIDFIKNVRK